MLVFKSLDEDAIRGLLHEPRRSADKPLPLDEEARASLVRMADGDGRAALTLAEEVWRSAKPGETFDAEALQEIIQRRAPIYDKGQEGHYNLISALHKTIRGSDPDAALYYLARMLDAGEDRLFIARRLVRMAVEDIGLADPQALVDRQCGQGRVRFPRLAGGRTGAGAGRGLSGDRAEIERRLHGLQGRDAGRQGARLAACRRRPSSTPRPS